MALIADNIRSPFVPRISHNQDERLRTIAENEQDRRDRLQAKLDGHKSRTEQSALAFLQAPAGKAAVNDKLSWSVNAAEKLKNAAVVVGEAIPTTVGVARRSTMTGPEASKEASIKFLRGSVFSFHNTLLHGTRRIT